MTNIQSGLRAELAVDVGSRGIEKVLSREAGGESGRNAAGAPLASLERYSVSAYVEVAMSSLSVDVEQRMESIFAVAAERYVFNEVAISRENALGMMYEGKEGLEGLAGRLLGGFNQFTKSSSEELGGAARYFVAAVTEGFAFARGVSEQYGGLSERSSVRADVQYEQVVQGVARRVEFASDTAVAGSDPVEDAAVVAPDAPEAPVSGDEAAVAPSAPAPAPNDLAVTADNDNDAPVVTESGSAPSSAAYFTEQRARSFDFSLTTRDGDRVTISMASLLERSGGYTTQAESTGASFAAGAQQLRVGDYVLSVEGDLDEGELEAIADLLVQVTDISESFFGGDFNEAFNKALDVGFDGSEIAAFSLDLLQVERQTIGAYTGGAADAAGGYEPIAQLSEKLLELADQFNRSVFEAGAGEVSGLLSQLNAFNARMQEQREALLAPSSDVKAYVEAVMQRILG